MKRFMTYTRGFTALLIVLMILAGSIAFSDTLALDTADNSQQLEYTGGWNPTQYPVDGTLYKDRIAVSRTIAPTEIENYFDVTLSVVAKPRVIDSAVDVVVVMDISNTMNSTHQGLGPNDAGYDINDARLTHAKSAVNSFLDRYSTDSKLGGEHRFGLVTFNSHASTVIPLTKVNSAEDAQGLKTKVDAITAPTDNRERFTNTEGGLQLAYNLLKDSEATFRYVIFVTDGMPTTYIEAGRESESLITGYNTYMKGAYSADKAGTDGYFADAFSQKVCTYGVNYSDKAADRADDVAQMMKNAGINICSAGMDVDTQSVLDFLKLAENTSFTTVDRQTSSLVVGATTETYELWLSEDIAGGAMIETAQSGKNIQRYASVKGGAELTTAFENILTGMELIPAETMEEAYTLDPLDEGFEFIYFFDAQGNPTTHVTNTSNGKDVAVYDADAQTVRWWLRTTQSWYIDEIGNYVLSLKYRVRLKNEAHGFVSGTPLDTNKNTAFYFKTVDFSTGEALFGDNSIEYPVTKSQGYLGSLEFTKIDAVSGLPLAGAQFTLQHYGDSCNICHGDAVIAEATAESNRRGVVKFENIPSGHEYVLIETKAPEGYKCGAYHSVNVSYGQTYLDSVLVNKENPAVIGNHNIEPVVIQLRAKAQITGRELTAEEFVFSLTGVFEFGNRFHEIAPCDENGNVEFHEIRFDQPGTYKFRMYEENLSDTSVIYDTKEYEVVIDVALSEDEASYIVTTTVDGVPAEDALSPAPLEFTNTLRQTGRAQLAVDTTLDSATPEDGVFKFTLRDNEGQVLQTKSSTDGKVVFDEIDYTAEGVVRYSIGEEHDDELFNTVLFDHTVYNVFVTVTAPEGDGAFETKVEYFFHGEPVDAPVFRNETRHEATLRVDFLSTLDTTASEADRFVFELRDAQGEVIDRVRNMEQGVVSLNELRFDKVGYYTYTIRQIAGEDNQIAYDETIYNMYVTVEARHNLNNYFLEVDIKQGEGESEKLVLHAHGVNLDIKEKSELIFANNTADAPTVPEETTGTVPPPAEDVTGETQKPTQGTDVDAPYTGTYSNALVWIAIVFVIGGTVAIVCRKRKQYEE